MARRPRQSGMTLIEIVTALAIIAIAGSMTVPALYKWRTNLATKAVARSLADLLTLARTEAMRTQTNHAVFFWVDASSNALTDVDGRRVAAMLIRDDNTDGAPQSAEIRATVPVDTTGSVGWGVTASAQGAGAAPGDPDPNGEWKNGWSFVEPDGDPAQWVVFGPDGIPRGFTVTPAYDDGGAAGIGTGQGGVYVNNGDRNFAIVLSAMGGVRVHPYSPDQSDWMN